MEDKLIKGQRGIDIGDFLVCHFLSFYKKRRHCSYKFIDKAGLVNSKFQKSSNVDMQPQT